MSNITEPTTAPAPAKASTDRVKAPLVGVLTGIALVGGLGFWTMQRVNAANAAQAEVAERRAEDSKRASETANAPPTVEVTQGKAGEWLATIELTGTLEAAESAKLAFRAPGKIRTINGKVGDVIRAGHVLATLDSGETRAQLAVNEAQIRASEAQLALAADAERRTLALVQSGSAAEASGVQTEKQKALAAAQLEAAKAQESLIRVNLSNQTLVAPFPGTLTRAPKGVGAVVNPGEALFELVNTETLTLASTIAEGDANVVAPGAVVKLRTSTGEAEGVVRAVLGTLDPQTRRVPVQVEFKNPGFLRAGAFVRASVSSPQKVEVVRLPHTVLRPGSQDEILVVQPAGGVLELRKIVYVTDTDGTLLVRTGVTTSERVVVSPTAESSTGDRVQVKLAVVGKGNP
jgi:RND family efflux transporter MFP subunit